MAKTNVSQSSAKKAAFEAAYKAALSGKPLSQGAVNKIYAQELERTNATTKAADAQPEQEAVRSRTQDIVTKTAKSRPVRLVTDVAKDTRTAKQKYEDSQKAYDEYLESEEYQKNRKEANKVNLQEAITKLFNVAGGPTSDPLMGSQALSIDPKDTKERELKETVDRYKAQMDAEESARTHEANMKEISAMSDEERAQLEQYIQSRDSRRSVFVNDITWFQDYNKEEQSKKALIEKYGEERLEKLAESYGRHIHEQEATKTVEDAQKAVNQNWMSATFHNLLGLPARALGGVEATVGRLYEQADRTGQYPTLEEYTSGDLLSLYGNTVMSQTAENIAGDEYDESGQQTKDGGFGRELLSYGYQGGMSLLDSLARSAAAGGAAGGAALAATGSFSQAVSDASRQGATPGQAAAMGIATAGMEYLAEKIPMDEIFKLAKGGNTKALRAAFRQAGIELATEELTLFGTLAAEAAILQEKSSYRQQIGELVANGMSFEEAKKQANKAVWEEAKQTAFVSGFSGLLGGAGGAVFGNKAQNNRTQETPQQTAPAAPVVDEGQQIIEAAGEQLAQQATATPQETVTETPEQMLAEMVGAELAQNAPEQPAAPQLTQEQQNVENGIAATLQAAMQGGGQISNKTAEAILNNPVLLQKVMENSGIEMGNTKAEQRKAVKDAVAQMAPNTQLQNRTGNAVAETMSAPAQNDEQATTNAVTKPLESYPAEVKGIGAAEQDFSGSDQKSVGAMASQFKHEVKDSKVYSNTYTNTQHADIRDVGRAAKNAAPNIDQYDVITEAESIHEAELRTETGRGRWAEHNALMKKAGWTGADNDTAMRLLTVYRKEGKTDRFLELSRKQRQMGTQAGQMVQSFAKYSRGDATVAVQDAIADLDNLTIDQVDRTFWKTKQETKGAQNKKDAFQKWKESITGSLLEVANDIENVEDGDKESMTEIVRQIANFRKTTAWAGNSSNLTRRTERGLSKMDFDTLKTVAKTQLSMIPMDFRKRNAGEIAKAIRVQNMLFTLTTTAKNLAGNTTNGLMDAVSDSTIGQMIDAVLGKVTGVRTVGNDVRYVPEYIRAAIDSADVAAAFVSLDIPMEADAKYTSGKTRTWSPNSGQIGRMMSAYEKHMKYALEVSDKFYEGGARQAVHKSLEKLGENSGLSQEQIDDLSEKTGQRRTFKDPGYYVGKDGNPKRGRALARTNVGLQKALNNIGTENIGLGDLLMPFAAVSGEVKQVGLDYTGGGIISGIKEISSIIKDAKNGKEVAPYRQRSAATNFGRGVTGIGLVAAFTAMAASGAFKVSNDRDNEERIMDQTQGLAGAQWNIDSSLRWWEAIANGHDAEQAKKAAEWESGDTLVSIDFLEPYNSLMHIGYILSQDEEITVADAVKAVLQGNFEALLEMPMMETLSDLADLQKSFTEVSEGDMSGVLDATGQLLGTVAGSAIPNWLRQTAKVIDPNYRDTYDTDPIQKAIKEVIAGVPFASKQLPKKYDTLGEEQKRYENGEILKAAIETMVTPWDTQKYDTNAVYQEIERLNAIDGIDVTPPKKARKLTYTDKNGETHNNERLTEEQYQTLAETQGKTAKALLDKMIASGDYQALTDAQKASAIDAVYAYAEEQGKVAALPDYKSNADTWIKEAGKDPVGAVIRKYTGKAFDDAMKSMTASWTDKLDAAESVEALEAAYTVYSNMSQATRKAVKNDATGRVAAYMEARNNRIKTETFVDLYKTYWELDKSGKKANEKAQQWAYTLERAQESGKINEVQKNTLKEALSFGQYIPAEATKFNELTDSGLSATDAQSVTRAIGNLIPETGKSEVRDIQKWDAIVSMTLSDMDKIKTMRAYMTDKQEDKLDAVLDMGYSVDEYPEIWRIIDGYTSGTGKKKRTIAYMQNEFGISYSAAKKLYEVFK